MKKIMIALGIAFALIVGVFAIVNKPVDVDAINAERYESVVDEIESVYGEDAVYQIKPQITRDGLVDAYLVDVVEIDGIAVNHVGYRASFIK